MKTFIAWTSGSENRYQVIANSRKEALEKFCKLMGCDKMPNSYAHARPVKDGGEYCLLESGTYGITH